MRTSPAQTQAAPPPPRRAGQALKLFAAAVFIAFAAPLLLLAGLLAWHQHRIFTSWPAVDAVVTRAERTTTTSNTSQPAVTSYGARFTFRYTVAGREYDTSAELRYTSSAAADIERWLAQMPAGSHQRIRYDPANPANISVAAEYTPHSFAAPMRLVEWAGLITAISLIFFGMGWRAGRSMVDGSRVENQT